MLAANAAAGLPAIDVSPVQGKFLSLLVRIAGARRVLEVGTLGGYSTVWLARGLPEGGRVVTLELEAHHARVARANFAAAGVADRVDLREGPALASLERLAAEGAGPFDLIFIDADKPNNPAYLDWAIRLSRPGTVIIGDNVVRGWRRDGCGKRGCGRDRDKGVHRGPGPDAGGGGDGDPDGWGKGLGRVCDGGGGLADRDGRPYSVLPSAPGSAFPGAAGASSNTSPARSRTMRHQSKVSSRFFGVTPPQRFTSISIATSPSASI